MIEIKLRMYYFLSFKPLHGPYTDFRQRRTIDHSSRIESHYYHYMTRHDQGLNLDSKYINTEIERNEHAKIHIHTACIFHKPLIT